MTRSKVRAMRHLDYEVGAAKPWVVWRGLRFDTRFRTVHEAKAYADRFGGLGHAPDAYQPFPNSIRSRVGVVVNSKGQPSKVKVEAVR